VKTSFLLYIFFKKNAALACNLRCPVKIKLIGFIFAPFCSYEIGWYKSSVFENCVKINKAFLNNPIWNSWAHNCGRTTTDGGHSMQTFSKFQYQLLQPSILANQLTDRGLLLFERMMASISSKNIWIKINVNDNFVCYMSMITVALLNKNQDLQWHISAFCAYYFFFSIRKIRVKPSNFINIHKKLLTRI
jgi:hypothetical protein